MSVQALQDYTFISKYARYNIEKGRRETWDEAVNRVRDMHLRKYPSIQEEINWAFEQVRQKKVLGSQRALQFGGKPIEKKNERIYNCCFSYCDRLRFFQESLFLLLCGTGVGFSVQRHHIDKLPNLNKTSKLSDKTYVIPDSIEGWADALGVLLSSYFEQPVFNDYNGYCVNFDYSLIRPKGALLSSGAGKAPGPDPLKKSLEQIRNLLDRCLKNNQNKLKPIDAYDIIMHASDAVLSGGVRRSATICLFSLDDEEMINAKIGNWRYENPQRGRSNNSAILLRDKVTFEQFERLIKSTREFGEPGFFWVDNLEFGANPCLEIGLYAYDNKGNSGFQFCNLTEINGKKIKTIEDFEIACKASAIIGTCQAGYTKFDYLGEVTENITEKESLLGVSITGFMENPDVLLNTENQIKMANLIKDLNQSIAKKIGIPPAARLTCCKPAGTTSCLLGTSSGIHPHHAKRYFRRVQANELETPYQYFAKHNPMAIEKSVWSANKTDIVISFCIEVEKGSKLKNDLSALDMLKIVKDTQQNWVEYGTNSNQCADKRLRHNVSNTVTVKPEEWEEVTKFIYENKEFFGGVSLIPQSGDKDYPQAPFCAVHTPRELVQIYGDGILMASGLIVDGLRAFDNDLWKACDIVLGLGEPIIKPEIPNPGEESYKFSAMKQEVAKYYLKIDWIRRAKQFADRYFENIKEMTYALKDVHNWHSWCSLNREYKEVDYSQMFESDDNTTVQETIACAGGVCEII